jgi:hypothetical protein
VYLELYCFLRFKVNHIFLFSPIQNRVFSPGFQYSRLFHPDQHQKCKLKSASIWPISAGDAHGPYPPPLSLLNGKNLVLRPASSGNSGLWPQGGLVKRILLSFFLIIFSKICRYIRTNRTFPAKSQSGKLHLRGIEDPGIAGRVGK